MKYTSAEANKLLRKLIDRHSDMLLMEEQSREFLASMGEDAESLRPIYDYKAYQEELDKLEADIRKVKHAINLFNLTKEVPGFHMTVDQLLVYLPQLTARKTKLYNMKNRLPKMRDTASGLGSSKLIDYSYANYDIAAASADFEEVSDRLSRAQTALDLLNTTETMEIDI